MSANIEIAKEQLNNLWHADAWVFDLDNTIYAPHINLFAQIDVRMGQFIVDLLDIPPTQARVIQKGFVKTHGTTLSGLMDKHDVDPSAYMRFVHNIDYSILPRDDILKAAIDRLPGNKYIFTNGSVDHAKSVLTQMDMMDCFDDFFDVGMANYIPKPHGAAYDSMIAHFGIDHTKSVMVEDMMCNLRYPKEIGMQTIWVENDNQFARNGVDESVIDYKVSNLSTWLDTLVRA